MGAGGQKESETNRLQIGDEKTTEKTTADYAEGMDFEKMTIFEISVYVPGFNSRVSAWPMPSPAGEGVRRERQKGSTLPLFTFR